MSEPLPFLLRPAVDEDHAFIVDSWVRSYRGKSRDSGSQVASDWKRFARAALVKCATLVCCLEDDHTSIVGFAVTRGNTVLYVYVRDRFRRMGVAKSLLAPFIGRTDVVVGAVPAWKEKRMPEGWRFSWLANALALVD